MRISFLDKEYWWGGIVNLGETMPYDKYSECEIDLSTIKLSLDQSAPLFVSSKGRYIWSENPFLIRFWHGEILIPDTFEVELNEEGSTLRDACMNLAKKKYHLSGKVPDPLFFEQPQYNTWIELNIHSSQEKILEYAENIIRYGMPAGILMIDGGWQIAHGYWEFQPELFPDPQGMIKRLHELGFKVMLWTIPAVSVSAPDYDRLKEVKLLLHDCSGKPAQRWWWGGRDTVLDLSNSQAVRWYTDQLNHLQVKYGADGFKFDGGDAYFYDSGDQSWLPLNEQEQMSRYEGLGEIYPFHEFRCGWKGMGKPLVHRLQDKMHTWNGQGLNQIIPHSVLQGLTGNFFHCPDMIGGGVFNELFETAFDEELYIRWMEVSAFCPMIQFSLAPWRVLSDENRRIVEKMYRLHQNMAPLFLELAAHAASVGEPVMRNMAYEFPEEGLEQVWDQFMLGSKILAAPVLEKGKTGRSVILPSGIWQADDGTRWEGGQTIEIQAGLERLPFFVRLDRESNGYPADRQ